MQLRIRSSKGLSSLLYSHSGVYRESATRPSELGEPG